FTFEVRCECEGIQKAFARGRYPNEPSSDAPVDTPAPRTKRLLAEAKAAERIEIITSKTDWQSQITRMWQCREPLCDNYQYWCYVHQATQEHFKISPADQESWAMKLIEGTTGVSVAVPPMQLIDYWRTQGSQLKVNPNRGKSSKRRRSRSSSDDGLRRIEKKLERRQLQNLLIRMEQDEALQSERSQLQRIQFEAMRSHHLSGAVGITGLPSAQGYTIRTATTPQARPNTPPAVVVQSSSRLGLSSSPVEGAGTQDTRATVRAFFTWLVGEQPEDDQDDHLTASEVAIEQRWTIGDLQKMDKPSSDLYTIAVSTFKLKDGIVRRFRDDIRRFKKYHRARRTDEVATQAIT
ncbi:MAG: hypothetical protein Q9174_006466, partial [Haloplaca sp. 1 TL-2023]